MREDALGLVTFGRTTFLRQPRLAAALGGNSLTPIQIN